MKLKYQESKRYYQDHYINHLKFASEKRTAFDAKFSLALMQEIKQGQFYLNKIHNIDLCITRLQNLVIHPEQVFSFWYLVPQPTRKNGFKSGRNLVNGQISEDIGGGICQVSCGIYINALKSGLEILERHPHSVDIYEEDERFTPLGSDATVVYGYKDLRFKNTLKSPIQICLERHDNKLSTMFKTLSALTDQKLEFVTEYLEDHKLVSTLLDQNVVTTSIYRYKTAL